MTRKPMWMVRAEVGGRLFEEFKSRSLVAIGWNEMGEMSALKTREDFSKAVTRAYPDNRRGQTIVAAGQAYRFVREFAVGDRVITYDPSEHSIEADTHVTGSPHLRATGSTVGS